MEYRKKFKEYVRSRIQFIEDGSFERAFGETSIRILYATAGQTLTDAGTRREAMCRYTMELLTELKKENWADVFRFAAIDYETLFDLEVFEKPIWYRPGSPVPLTLLTP
jgi:hypothetical protein